MAKTGKGESAMLGRFLAVMALTCCLWAVKASAGEDMLAMRGGVQDGVNKVDMPDARLDRTREGTREKTDASARVPYLRWKDSCVRRPMMVAGHTLEIKGVGAFGLARPYVARPEPMEKEFFELLLRELTRM